MLVYCVNVTVKPENVAQFIEATRENAINTVREPGNLRFDVVQVKDDPCRFILYEVYRGEEAVAAHKETAHYLKWREAVADWMARPRQGIKCDPLYPDREDMW